MRVGIEAMHFYGGRTFLDIRNLFEARGLDMRRFDNLMVHRKTVALPCEDPVSYGVNAAKPIVGRLGEGEKNRIELLITATESGIDFGKSVSTYLHHYLGLDRNCRLFEVKHACYGGTAALQMAAGMIASNTSPGAKALIVATDIGRTAIRGNYVEPTQGAGAVAMLIGDQADVLELDFGATGFHGYEVMDTCRPTTEIETGDSDLSLISYLECLEHSFKAYSAKVDAVDFVTTFDYLAFHTPFPGMVKGAHRMLMRKLFQATPQTAEADFDRRVKPSLEFCSQIGNIYSATVYLALCGLIANVDLTHPKRVGIYSYGSGCCGEFYSGVISTTSQRKLSEFDHQSALSERYPLSMPEYDALLEIGMELPFGTKDKVVDCTPYQSIYDRTLAGRGLLVLDEIRDYHRIYKWS
jgi:polyketide biosynthesis 3-hydroxy-3-methylglutaryl-CoA synthase-like enzyme PksG